MKLGEFADVIGKDLLIRRYANQNNRFTCAFDGSEVKEGCFLRGGFGDGDTVEKAIADYVQQIRGKHLVFNAYTPKREDYEVPATLEP